jgi:hypothetical protein
MIVMDFSMVKIGPYFHKSIEGAIWTFFNFFPSQENVSTKSTWGSIHMDSYHSMTYVWPIKYEKIASSSLSQCCFWTFMEYKTCQ